nr:PT domain-containing protein [Lachnospiraceae bacterium]
GKRVKYDVDKNIILVTEDVAALGHDFGEPVFNWTEDCSKCTLTLTCNRDNSHVEAADCTISCVRTEPTETADGEAVYTAKASIDGVEYNDVRKMVIVKTESGNTEEMTELEAAKDKIEELEKDLSAAEKAQEEAEADAAAAKEAQASAEADAVAANEAKEKAEGERDTAKADAAAAKEAQASAEADAVAANEAKEKAEGERDTAKADAAAAKEAQASAEADAAAANEAKEKAEGERDTAKADAAAAKEAQASAEAEAKAAKEAQASAEAAAKESVQPSVAPSAQPSSEPTASSEPSASVEPTASAEAVTKPAKAKINSAKNNAKSTVLVVLKKISGANGYQLQYSLKKNFKGKKTKNTTALKVKINKLKKKKTYYIRVRAYKVVDGKKVYGAWSTVKRVKIKK